MEWKKLSQLVERKICYGIVQPGKGKNGNIPVIKVNNIISGLKSITELDTTTHEIASKFQRTQLFGGEIVVSVVGSVGNTAIVPSSFKGCNLVRATAMVDIKDKVLATYVMYYFKTHEAQKYIESRLNTTVQATLNIKDLEEMPIPILQSSIILRLVSILSALDAKIENNNKINANLEAQAEALFKSWFVDFTPFKDQPFVDSELGPIPQGWKVGTLFDVANLHDRYRRPLSSNQRSLMAKKYPYYGATSLMDFVEDYIFDGEYVLMGEDGSVVTEKGYPFIQYVWGKIWVNNHAHVLSGKDGFPTELLIPFLKTYNIKGLVTGAVQAKLNQANMAQIQIPIPPKKNINNLSVIIKSIYKKYRLLTEENQRLAALRDTLLPKLMSGEIKL